MNTEVHLLRRILELLNESSNYAILRNYQNIPKQISRDIDIIINRKDFFKIRRSMVSILNEHGYQMLMYYKGGEMHSVVFASYKECTTYILSFDFLFSIYVRDMVLFTADQVLKNREYNGVLYHVRKDWEYLAKYIYNTILGVPYPAKYLNIKKEAESLYKKEIEKQLDAIGVVTLSNIKNMSIRVQLFRIHPWLSLIAVSRYLYYTIYNMLSVQGISIGFTGPDGAGKTTVINSLMKELNSVFSNIKVFHFRPTLYGNLSDVAYSAGVKKTIDNQYHLPHRAQKTGICSSFLRLLYYSMDYLFGALFKINTLLFRRNVVIFDRYYTDIICDSRRSRIHLPKKFLYWWGRCFIPSLDYNILLTADSDTILRRKHELNREGIDAINRKIDYLAPKPGYYKILNTGTPQETVAKILTIIFDAQHRKNLRRLGAKHNEMIR